VRITEVATPGIPGKPAHDDQKVHPAASFRSTMTNEKGES